MPELAAEEKLAIIKRICRGYADQIAVRLVGPRWELVTPAWRLRPFELPLLAIAGEGADPAEAIDDCWRQLIEAPFLLLLEGRAPRGLRWDGIAFRD